MADYANPDVLVTTEWVAAHGGDAGIRLLEVDVDTEAYAEGHITGAVGLNWQTQLCDQVRRDILTKDQFEALCNDSGIANDTTIIFYGDNNNWFATYALWQFRYYGHDESLLKVMNGGRQKWIDEGRDLVTDVTDYPSTGYQAKFPDDNVRATADTVRDTLGASRCEPRRCPFTCRILWRSHRTARYERDRATRRTYPWRSEHPVGDSCC